MVTKYSSDVVFDIFRKASERGGRIATLPPPSVLRVHCHTPSFMKRGLALNHGDLQGLPLGQLQLSRGNL